MSKRVVTGLDRLKKSLPRRFSGLRAGLLVHPASISRDFQHAASIVLNSRKVILSALFGPQHGIHGETQDNMIEWQGFTDPVTLLPVYSLYGDTRKPLPEMLENVDVMIIDLQDVGSRYYTFIWSMALVMDACEEMHKSVIVLDRPNPIGGILIEGPVTKKDFSSFVGLHPLPVRHGMTIGEIALCLRDRFYHDLDLHVLEMIGWKRRTWFNETSLPWVSPSPNMPSLDTAAVYPGMCLLEGTNVSEGRGTTRPFEIFGAPFIDPVPLIRRLKDFNLRGVFFRPIQFMPTFHKFSGTLCGGAQIHVTNRASFRPFKTAVGILKAVNDLYPDYFSWKPPPYEYETVLLPIDILAGSDRLRREIEHGSSLGEMETWWKKEAHTFDGKTRKKYLLYE